MHNSACPPTGSVDKVQEGTMSHTNRNFVFAYILLVGLPLLGLAGVLRTGRSLTAPISVDGTWKIEADAGRIATQPCAQYASVFSSFMISQSGKSFVLTLNDAAKTVASGALDGKSLKASVVPAQESAGKSGCSGDQSLTLTAAVDPATEPRSMNGTVSVTGCASCAPVGFHAVRQPRAAAGGAH
jgi:hypothetical protein